MKKHIWFLLSFAVLLSASFSSCQKLDMRGIVKSSGYWPDFRFNEYMQYNYTVGDIVLDAPGEEYNVYACSDLHVQDEAQPLGQLLAKLDDDSTAMFCCLNGDLTNNGHRQPFLNLLDTVDNHQIPCFATIGNHDLFFNCYEFYKEVFHTSTYTVTVRLPDGKQDLYIFLDSGSGTLGAKQNEWLSNVLQHRWNYRYCVVFTHTYIFRTTGMDAGNFSQEESYALMDMMQCYDVNLFVMGHFHRSEHHLFKDVDYIMTDDLRNPPYGYLKIHAAPSPASTGQPNYSGLTYTFEALHDWYL